MHEIETERLQLRQYSLDDADFVLDLCSRWKVQRFLGVAPRLLRGRDEAVALIERWHGRQDRVHRVWAVEHADDGRLLGTVLLVAILGSGSVPRRPTGETEIGWYLHPDSWGHGYATEAAAAGLRHGFDAGLPEVLAVTHPENTASQAVCRRLGMQHHGRTERYYDMACELFRLAAPSPAAPAPGAAEEAR